MTTAIYSHAASLAHQMPPGHPEQIARIEVIESALRAIDGLTWIDAPDADTADILRCHPQSYLDRLAKAAPASGIVSLDADTSMSPGTLAAARHAVGGNCAAVDLVLSGKARNAFVATRPPGHHAERETPMGFCLFGNIAIAAKRALDHHGLNRVAVIDFDVHHGNGTADLLWSEDRVRFVSSHQMPLWPGSGAAHETGAHGQITNIPFAPGTSSQQFRTTYDREVLPMLHDYAPELVLISAGFDAHKDDPLAQMNLTRDDFVWITERLCDLADATADGRIVSTLEGGYDLPALAACTAAHVTVLKERAR